MPLAPGEVLKRDVYPAEVAFPDGAVITKARVFATSHRVQVWQMVGGRIELTHELELADPGSIPAGTGSMGRGALEVRLAGDEGTAWINQGRGCGCGSPLKAMGPPVPRRV